MPGQLADAWRPHEARIEGGQQGHPAAWWGGGLPRAGPAISQPSRRSISAREGEGKDGGEKGSKAGFDRFSPYQYVCISIIAENSNIVIDCIAAAAPFQRKSGDGK